MATQTVTLPAPVTLPDAKPSDLIESLPEDRWMQGSFRTYGGGPTRYCSLGILLEHAGFDWFGPGGSVQCLLAIYGISKDDMGVIGRLNDSQGKAAVVAYLRERGL